MPYQRMSILDRSLYQMNRSVIKDDGMRQAKDEREMRAFLVTSLRVGRECADCLSECGDNFVFLRMLTSSTGSTVCTTDIIVGG
jgi:hypothetical protein